MEYDINPEGKLKLSREGLYTIIEARLPPGDKLLRLYARGDGKTASLGLVEPGGCFRKKFSRLQYAALPENIQEFFTLGSDEKAEESVTAEPEKNRPGENAGSRAQTPHWELLPDGSIRASAGCRTYLALPARLRKIPPGIRLINFRGEDYMVFRY